MNTQLILLVLIVAVVAGTVYWNIDQQKRKVIENRTAADRLRDDHNNRREIVLREMNFLGDLVENKSISVAEFSARAAKSIAIMESQDTDGDLAGPINETKEHIAAEIQKRQES